MLSVINILIRANLSTPAIFLARVFKTQIGDLNRRDFLGATITGSVIAGNDPECLKPLMKLGWKPSGRLYDGLTALSASIVTDRQDVFNRLIALRVNPSKRNIDGSTPLMIAAQIGDLKKLRTLLSRGANVNDQDPRGWTAAHRAVFYRPKGWKMIVKALIAHGFDQSIADYTGRRALELYKTK